MELFRKNQKLIFWIVTIIIVPSFVLVWGAGGLFESQQQTVEFDAGVVNGNNVSYREFDAFRRRLQSASGGLPLYIPYIPGVGTPAEELWKHLAAYAILQDAGKAGVRASDLEVGTYLANEHPVIANRADRADRQALERAVDEYCRQMQITRQDLLRGIRELRTIGNYLSDDSAPAAINDDTAFLFYALPKSEAVIKRIRVMETDDIKDQATREIMEKPEDQREKDARDYALGKSSDSRYRDPSTWRFAYVLVPFVAAASVRPPEEQEIRDQYETGKTSTYADLTFEDAADRIKGELVEREVDRQTLRNLTVDVDPQLRQQGESLPLDELAKLTPLAKYGVVTGDTGDELLSIDALNDKLPSGFEADVRAILQIVDESVGDEKNAIIQEWKAGFNLAFRPFKSDKGYFRLRLLDYQPSSPAAVDDDGGKIKPGIFENAVADMISDRIDELVTEKAAELEAKLRAHAEAKETGGSDTEPEIDELLASLPSESIAYPQLVNQFPDLIRLVVGELVGPLPFEDAEAGTSGQELILLTDRRVPTREDFEAETPEAKAEPRQTAGAAFGGGQSLVFGINGPAMLIRPGPSALRSLWRRFYARELEVNPELLRSVGAEG